MVIKRVDLYPIEVRLNHPVAMASGVIARCENVLVKVTDLDGATGWGEGVSALTVTGDGQDAILDGLRVLAPRLLGEDPFDVERLAAVLTMPARTSLSAIDLALWDLRGQLQQAPVTELVGGARRTVIPGLTLVGTGSAAGDVATIADKVATGWTWFKLKVAMSDVEDEAETVRQITEQVGPDGVVCADANEGWDEATARRFLFAIDGSALAFLEQPVARGDSDALGRLCHAATTPICADESAGRLEDLAVLAGIGVKGVSLKLIKHGGISGVMRGGALCERLALEINLAGKVAETSISAAANLHCAAALPKLEFGCSPANQGLVMDVSEKPIAPIGGSYPVPAEPGLGVIVDESLVARLLNGSVETIL